MNILQRLKIGHVWSPVESLTKDPRDQSVGRRSMVNPSIRLADTLSLEANAEVFFHEVTHQILLRGDDRNESHREQFVTYLANGLSHVLKDNQLLKK